MKAPPNRVLGYVASLHFHPANGGEKFQATELMELEAGKGIVGNPRYFARRNRSGQSSSRQVSLIGREQIVSHAATLGLKEISAGTIRSNIETTGVDLISLINAEVMVGEAVMEFYEARTGCGKMDAICNGLQSLTSGNRLGVLARVVRSGRIQVGDCISVINPEQDGLRKQLGHSPT